MRRLAAVLFLLLVLPARANLGDTVADSVKRYGKPLTFTEASAKNPFGTLVFVAGPYQLIVFLFDGVEVGARVSKKDKSAFTPAEMKIIMDADAPTPWTPVPHADPGTLQWVRGDKATVAYDEDKKLLIFTLPQMLAEMRTAPPEPAATNAPPAGPKPPEGNFAPAAPTQWAPTNAPPVTNAAPSP